MASCDCNFVSSAQSHRLNLPMATSAYVDGRIWTRDDFIIPCLYPSRYNPEGTFGSHNRIWWNSGIEIYWMNLTLKELVWNLTTFLVGRNSISPLIPRNNEFLKLWNSMEFKGLHPFDYLNQKYDLEFGQNPWTKHPFMISMYMFCITW